MPFQLVHVDPADRAEFVERARRRLKMEHVLDNPGDPECVGIWIDASRDPHEEQNEPIVVEIASAGDRRLDVRLGQILWPETGERL